MNLGFINEKCGYSCFPYCITLCWYVYWMPKQGNAEPAAATQEALKKMRKLSRLHILDLSLK